MDYIEHILGIALIVLYWLFTAAVTLRVLGKRTPVSVTLSWLLVIYILPVVGAALYLMLGELNLGRQRARRAEEMVKPFLSSIAEDFQGPRGSEARWSRASTRCCSSAWAWGRWAMSR